MYLLFAVLEDDWCGQTRIDREFVYSELCDCIESLTRKMSIVSPVIFGHCSIVSAEFK
jgi:hypothetical protein